MVAYATATDFIDTFGEDEALELSNIDTPEADEINTTRLTQVIELETGRANGYIASKYATPLDPVPTAIKDIILDMARYKLDKNRQREDVRQRYEDAIDYLKGIASGKIALVDDDGTLITVEDAAGEVAFGAFGYSEGLQTFTSDTLAGYNQEYPRRLY